MGKILIAYISKTGSTKEISEEIEKIMEENGFQIEALASSGIFLPLKVQCL